MNRSTIPNLDPSKIASPTRLRPSSSGNSSPVRNSGSPQRRQQISEMEQQVKKRQEESRKRIREEPPPPQQQQHQQSTESHKRVHFQEEVLEVEGRAVSPLKESKEVFWSKLDNIESMLLQMNERLFDIQKLQEKIYTKLNKEDIELIEQIEQVGKSINEISK